MLAALGILADHQLNIALELPARHHDAFLGLAARVVDGAIEVVTIDEHTRARCGNRLRARQSGNEQPRHVMRKSKSRASLGERYRSSIER